MTATPTYDRAAHLAAVAHVATTQQERTDAHAQPERSVRVWESMAPEASGTDAARTETLLIRCRLAAVATRSAARRATMTAGETP